MSFLDLSTSYPGFALDVSIRWDTRVLVLFGASGCGKSTVLEALAGLRPEVLGKAEIDGRAIHDSDRRLDPARRLVGWVPQDAALFPHLDVRRNIAFGRRGADRELEERAIDVLGLRLLLDRPIDGLSGGERQRVAIARALASGAKVLLLDEPLAALDTTHRGRILEYLRTLVDTLETPTVYVSHDPAEVRGMGGHVAVLDGGRVIAEGDAATVFGEARVLSVLELLGVENRFRVDVVGHRGGLCIGRTKGGSELVMSAPRGPAGLFVAVRSEDHDGLIRVRVADDVWTARVTAEAVAELGLVTGSVVWLVLKTSAIHVSTSEDR